MYLYSKKWLTTLYCVLLSAPYIVCDAKSNEYNSKDSLVEVRAVFINCESDSDNPDSEMTRFQRQELFKHNALRDCNKKLAVTIKMATEPEAGWLEADQAKDTSPGDEYIPIDHVFEGAERKRVRLLNPYILRLRRDAPKQAYKLRRIDTVSGVLINENSKLIGHTVKRKKQVRRKRSADDSEGDEFFNKQGSVASIFSLGNNPARRSFSQGVDRLIDLYSSKKHQETETTKGCEKREVCLKPNNASLIRDKRYKPILNEYDYDKKSDEGRRLNKNNGESRDYKTKEKGAARFKEIRPRVRGRSRNSEISDNDIQRKDKLDHASKLAKEKRFVNLYDENDEKGKIYKSSNFPGKDFAQYEIGTPNLWYTVKVQLFEKLSTPEGKTVWNDLTQGDQASVSSASPEWKGQDMNLRYKSTQWVPRNDFTLPMTSLCLLEPLRDSNYTVFEDEPASKQDTTQDYIVVPIEDVIGLKDTRNNNHNKRNEMSSNLNEDYPEINEHRRVEIRVSRAIFGSSGDKYDVAALGEDRYLTLPYRRPHHAQIDLEVRADDNQLVRVGSSGRISTIVADNTRKSRTVLTVQATNTGLASAHFKAVAREFGPELSTLLQDKGCDEITTGPVLLPPYHTQRLHLEIPVEVPLDITRCNVALVNDKDESVAVREVAIKKGDRCFCVWHCECVCLSEDPKLLCREMSTTQQTAAGLSTADKPRRARSLCYADNMVLNITGIVFGVLAFLLQLGLVKAILGLKFVKVGQWGLDKLLQPPRRLNCYFENDLRKCKVVYDDAGWPVHPETGQRTVRVICYPMEFLLNLIMFIAMPSLLLFDLLRKSVAMCKYCTRKACTKYTKDANQVYSSQDIQSTSGDLTPRRKRRRALRQWMTPLAEELATDMLNKGIFPQKMPQKRNPNEMQPLLHETSVSKSGMISAVHSEQDDTDYVLMQMRKSRESLAKSQRKVTTDSAISSNRSYAKNNLPATSKH